MNENATKLPFDAVIENLVTSPAIQPSIDGIDMHRARDHGVPDYKSIRNLCSNENDTSYIAEEKMEYIEEYYRQVLPISEINTVVVIKKVISV